MENKRRILIFGFSVSEQKDGYAPQLAAMLADTVPDCDIVVRALGGMHPPEAVYVFDSAVPSGSFDVVILELMTTGYRFESGNRQGYGLSTLQFVAKALRRNAQVIFLNLPRTDVDYTVDPYSRIAKQVSEALGVTYLDLASARSKEEYTDMLLDGVHTTEQSGRFFAEMVEPVVLAALNRAHGEDRAPFEATNIADSAQSILVSNMMPFAPTLDLQRSFNPVGVAIAGGISLPLTLYGELTIAGMTYFMGPTTGEMEVVFDTGESISIRAYDSFCYYNRLQGRLFSPQITCRGLTVTQSPEIPATILHKGEKNHGERLGAIVHLLVDAIPQVRLVEQWGHLWAVEE